MKAKVDFQLNRRFGVVERIVFRLVLNGFCNVREIKLSLPIFSDAVLANAVRHLINEQIITADVETGTLSLSEAIVAIIAMCQKQSLEIDIPSDLEDEMTQEGIGVFNNSIREAVELKDAILQELLPGVKLDAYRYSLDFIILPQRGV